MSETVVGRQYTIYLGLADLEPGYAVLEVQIVSDSDGRSRAEVGQVMAQGLGTLEAAREAVPWVADFCMWRNPEDDLTIVETWL